MTQQWKLPLVFFFIVAGMLVWRRFDTVSELPVFVVAEQNSPYEIGQVFERGEFIETGDDMFLMLQMGENVFISLDARTRIELHRLFETERVIRFTRGRMVVKNPESNPLLVNTNKTENTVANAQVIFINYDFQQLVTVAPIEGTVKTEVKDHGIYLSLPFLALNISESDLPSVSSTHVNTQEGPSAEFHRWTDALTQ